MPPQDLAPQSSGRLGWITALSVLFALGASLASAWFQGMTTDEPIHLEWSRRLLEAGITERQSDEHFDSKTPATMANVAARKFAKRRFRVTDPRTLLFCTRLPTVAALLGLLTAIFLIARAWLGTRTAHLATIASALDPNLIAHGSLATVDVAFALASLLVFAAGVSMVRKPTWRRGVALGAALGVAFATKFTAAFLLPVLALSPLALGGRRAFRRPRLSLLGVAALGLAAATCLAVICTAFRFAHVGTPLSKVPFHSTPFVRLAETLPNLGLPLPADFLTGLDLSLAGERSRDWKVVMLGRRHSDGVPYYFLLLWLLKTPLFVLLAQVLGLLRAVKTRLLFTDPVVRFLALGSLVFLGYFSLLFRTQLGYRYVLMCLPLGYLIAAAGLEGWTARRWLPSIALAGWMVALCENAAYLGNHLAFTNVAVQPKEHVFRLITDSNVDWGQNFDKVDSYLARAGLSRSRLDPPHVLPGRNLLRFELASGSLRFERHQWLRENVDPLEHFDHTYLLFQVDEAHFERFLRETRRLSPTVEGAAQCSGGDSFHALAPRASLSLPRGDRRTEWLFCISTPGGADVVLEATEGRLVLRRAPGSRDWDFLQKGQAVWYRLEPGVHAFSARAVEPFSGSWSVPRGAATFRGPSRPSG